MLGSVAIEFMCLSYVVRHITLFLCFTAELNAQMDELEALLATTARDNNDNATQNGNSFYIFIRASLQHYGICLLYNLEWYNVISRFTAELVAEIDELEALLAAPVHNNNSTQNGTY